MLPYTISQCLLVQIIFIMLLFFMIFTSARAAFVDTPKAQTSNWFSIGIWFKSLTSPAYQIVTQGPGQYKWWCATPVYVILYIADIVLWGVVVYLVAAANAESCSVGSQTLGVIMEVIATMLSVFTASMIMVIIYDDLSSTTNAIPLETMTPGGSASEAQKEQAEV